MTDTQGKMNIHMLEFSALFLTIKHLLSCIHLFEVEGLSLLRKYIILKMEHIILVTLSNKNFYNLFLVYTFDSYSFIFGTQLRIHNCIHMDRGA